MKLLILMPHKGHVSALNRSMLMRLGAKLLRAGHNLTISDDTTSGMLGHSRALLLWRLAAAQRMGYQKGLWIDSDTYFDEDRVLWAMQRPEDVIAWGYPVRIAWDVEYPPQNRLEDAARIREQPFRVWTSWVNLIGGHPVWTPDGQLVELAHYGFGAVMMSSKIAADMHGLVHQMDWDGRPISPAFDPDPDSNLRQSEDVNFWRRFRAKGHRIWCDPKPYVTNGESGGCFADEIKKRDRDRPFLCAMAHYAS